MQNIIIGGTHGLGSAIADKLRTNGEETFIVGRSYDESLHGPGLRIDLSSLPDAHLLASKIAEIGTGEFNFFWVSGYGYSGNFAEEESPEQMAAVNFGNVLPAAQAAWQQMVKASRPTHFVVISSSSGYKARKDEAVYAGTKHAQVGFTRSLGLESARLGTKVKVTLISPGGMRTPFWDDNRPASFRDFLDPVKVAARVLEQVIVQTEAFYEEIIERGSL
jgi:short-subunit dehydrogenase